MAMRKIVSQESNKHLQTYLSPVDAVRICEVACEVERNKEAPRNDGIELFINTGLCQCGKTSKILEAKLTLQDFSSVHDLNDLCKDNKARQKAVLLEKDTQPICCPYIGPKPDLPIGWKRPYAMGPTSLEGEYFSHIPIECGAFEECESVARQKGAEMAVFDVANSMCYLARNVVSLDDVFGVTKDNQYRYFIDLRENEAVL